MELTKKQKEILLSLIRKEIVTLELCVGGALEIITSDTYLTELVALRAAFKAKE